MDMELYDKLVDRFQKISKIKNPAVARQMTSNYLEPLKENILGEYDAVIVITLYLRVLHDMVSQNSEINFSDAAILCLKYMY